MHPRTTALKAANILPSMHRPVVLMLKRRRRRLSRVLDYILSLTLSIVILSYLINLLVKVIPTDREFSEAYMPSGGLWIWCDDATLQKSQLSNICASDAVEWSELKMETVQSERLAEHPEIENFLKQSDVNPTKVNALFTALMNDAQWIFVSREKMHHHGPKLVHFADFNPELRRYRLVFYNPGVFKPCDHLISEELALQRKNRQSKRTHHFYVVRRVSPRSVRVLADDIACMADAMSPPIAIMAGTFAAVTMDSVFLHRDLFWLTILHHIEGYEPSSRLFLSVVLQRLLWETEHELIFSRPDPAKTSGVNNCLALMSQYNMSGSSHWKSINRTFLHEVSQFRCSSDHSTFLQCALELVDFAFPDPDNNGLQQTLTLWFQTLDILDYEFPRRLPLNSNKLLHKRWGIPAIFNPSKSKPYFQLWKTLNKGKSVLRNSRRTVHDSNSKAKHTINKDVDLDREKDSSLPADLTENAKVSKETKTTENPNDTLDLVRSQQGDRISENVFTSLCRSENTTYTPVIPQRFKFDNILLIIVFNFPYLASHIPKLLTMYGRHFKHMLFCGEKIHMLGKYYFTDTGVRISYVQINHQGGHWAYSCTAAAIKMGYTTSGFLQVSDDVLLNVWNLEGLPLDKPWFQPRVRVADVRMRRVPDIATTSRWFPWIFGAGRLAAQLALRTLKKMKHDRNIGHKARTLRLSSFRVNVRRFLNQLRTTSGCSDCLMYEASDIFYVPSSIKEAYALFADLFHIHRLHLELAVPTILFGLVPEHDIVRLRGNYLWGEGPRAQFLKYYSLYDHFQHAWKLTRLADQAADGAGGLRFFCRVFLPRLDGDLADMGRRDKARDRDIDP
ncbi:hypothetical protein PoB_007341900 [Plakobranchus ocellatus]|uniref:Uncharacterized protein n=1 Tax=Plakobranchus ocellatus TaxID=259542 RepID=A0AAV4DRR4_9GAST|nr:hypothetical protein PoB_007341900 [Plakobranchus ocellatus]